MIGDSHEYGDAIEPFDKPHIDDLILAYLRTFLTIPDLTIAARWHGVYVKHPTEAYVVARPDAGNAGGDRRRRGRHDPVVRPGGTDRPGLAGRKP